jgi:uncharacterized protein YecT (DUF1311 family)
VRIIRFSAAAAIAAVCLTPTLAADVAMPSADECGNKQSQMEMNTCFDVRFKAADAAREKAFLELMVRLDEKQEKALRDVEEAWASYRDKQCAFIGSATEGGSVQPMIVSMCLTDLTEMRTKELAAQVTCEEGDLTCAAPPQPDN